MNDTTHTPGRRRKASGARKAIIAAVVVAVAGGGWYGWHAYKASKSKEGEYITAKIEKGDIEDLVTSTGTLQPRDYVDVGAQVSGQIEKLYVEVGDVVKKGDKLAEIDAETSKAKMDQSEASLASAKNSLETQRENLKKTERDYLRQKALYEQDATTKQAVLDAETAFENGKRSIKSSELDISSREASMRIDRKNLAFTSIVAPIDGTVMSIKVKEGQTVNASQQVPNVMQIANLNTMTVQSEVSEADVAKLYKGIPVYFTTLGGNSRRWYGELKRIEPTPKVQNSVVLYNALFDVVNDGGSLMPQMTAQVYFVSSEAKDVLMVPMAAIQQGQQISRELAQKERENKAKNAAPGAPGASPPGAAMAGTPGAPGAAPRGGATAQGAPAGAGPPRGSAGGPRAGGSGGPRGFNLENLTPEQREQMMSRARGQGGGNGPRPGGAGGFGRLGADAGAAAGPRPAQRRNGKVMVKKADGTLEVRSIVYGVTNRVHGQVLEGLKEGEEVVVGKREAEAAAAPPSQGNRNNQGGPPGGLPGGGAGGFPGGGPGGGGGGGGGGRPF